MKSVGVFTVCTVEQYPFAQVLKASLPANIHFYIGIIDGNLPHTTLLNEVLTDTLFPADYDKNSTLAASKPFFAHHFIKINPTLDALIYCDCTIAFYSTLDDIILAIDTADILLTPRITQPFGNSFYGDEKLFLSSGMYDNGFWAIKNNVKALEFLTWWQKMVQNRAYLDICHGMNYEQLWLNFVAIFFKNVVIINDKSWNVALHNLHERGITYKKGKWYINDQKPLVFMNFRECFVPIAQKVVYKYGAADIVNQYLKNLITNGHKTAAIFSSYKYKNPSVNLFKESIRAYIKRLIQFINTYPIYHKS